MGYMKALLLELEEREEMLGLIDEIEADWRAEPDYQQPTTEVPDEAYVSR